MSAQSRRQIWKRHLIVLPGMGARFIATSVQTADVMKTMATLVQQRVESESRLMSIAEPIDVCEIVDVEDNPSFIAFCYRVGTGLGVYP